MAKTRSRKAKTKRPRPPLLSLDKRGRQIQAVLELVRPDLPDEGGNRYDGYCGAASEAYLHLAGGRGANLRVMRLAKGDGTSHWWLENDKGVIDLTLSPADITWHRNHPKDGYRYEDGTGAMFRSGYARPSKRARAIIALVKGHVAN